MNHLIKYTYLSIFAALITIFLKLIAYFITNSVGLLSDAVESLVNFASALIAFFALKIAQKPADKNHPYGHTKAEYFSSIAEGIFIFFASLTIIFSAFNRLFYPKPLEKISLGLLSFHHSCRHQFFCWSNFNQSWQKKSINYIRG